MGTDNYGFRKVLDGIYRNENNSPVIYGPVTGTKLPEKLPALLLAKGVLKVNRLAGY